MSGDGAPFASRYLRVYVSLRDSEESLDRLDRLRHVTDGAPHDTRPAKGGTDHPEYPW